MLICTAAAGLAARVVAIWMRHGGGCGSCREGGKERRTRMHLALDSLWHALRLTYLLVGLTFGFFGAYRVIYRAQNGMSFSGRGYYIDLIVGATFLLAALIFSPRRRLALQLGLISSVWARCTRRLRPSRRFLRISDGARDASPTPVSK